jgi:hypothetical protein
VLKNVNKIDEFTVHSSNFNLIYVESLRGFDPDNIFQKHLQTLGLNDCFFKKHLSENRDTGGNALASDADDLDTLQSSTKLHRKQGKVPGDKSVQSANNTPKSTTSRSITPTTHHNNKATQSSSNGGGDKDPPHSKIDSSHKLPVDKKRKKNVGHAEELEIQSENMELETDLDSVLRYLDQTRDAIQHNHPMDISDTKIFDKDESFVFQSVVFDSQSKKLIIEKKDVKNKKGKSRSKVDLVNMWLSHIYQIHKASIDALHDSIGGIESENARLKDRVKELEDALIPMSFLVNPLEIAMPATPVANLKGSSSLLTSCKGYMENNIKKRMELVTEAWKTSQTITSLGTRAHSLLKHFQAELKDKEHFYLDTVLPFGSIVNNMTETKIRQQDLSSKN